MEPSALICTNHPDTDASVRRCARCLRPFCDSCIVRIGGRPFCSDCKLEQLRDVHSGVAPSVLPYATVGRRWAALIVDRLLVFGPLIVGAIAFAIGADASGAGDEAFGPLAIVLFLLWLVAAFLYEPLMTARDGQTVGKKMMSIRIVRTDGSPISTGQAWGRSLGRMAIATIASIIDYLPALFTEERTTIHDLMASTRVVRDA